MFLKSIKDFKIGGLYQHEIQCVTARVGKDRDSKPAWLYNHEPFMPLEIEEVPGDKYGFHIKMKVLVMPTNQIIYFETWEWHMYHDLTKTYQYTILSE